MRKILLLFLLIPAFFKISGQDIKPLSWSYSIKECSEQKFVLSIHAIIAPHWYIYAENMPDGGPLPMIIRFDETTDAIPGEPLRADKTSKSMYDDVFEMNVNYYEDTAVFVRKFIPPGNKFEALLYTEIQACYKKDGQCILIVEETLLQFEKLDGHWQISAIKIINQ